MAGPGERGGARPGRVSAGLVLARLAGGRKYHGRVRLARCLVVAGALAISACRPYRLEPPLDAQVIDRETGAPVAGATIRLDRTLYCLKFFRGLSVHPLKVREALTDRDGRFTMTRLSARGPCFSPALSEWLDIVAPGYLPATAHSTDLYESDDNPVRSSSFALERVRYRTELEVYARLQPRLGKETDSLLKTAVDSARRAPFRTAGDPGVFAYVPRAAFDRIAVVTAGVHSDRARRVAILVQDRRTGTFHAWTVRGDPVAPADPPAPGFHLLPGEGYRKLPLVVRERRLYFPTDDSVLLSELTTPKWFPVAAQFGDVRTGTEWGGYFVTVEGAGRQIAFYDLERWREYVPPRRKPGQPRVIRAGPRRALSDVLPGAAPPIECLVYNKQLARPALLFIAQAAGQRALFAVPYQSIGGRPLTVARVEAPPRAFPDEVTACAVAGQTFYVASKRHGLRILRITQPSPHRFVAEPRAPVVVTGPRGRLEFVSLAVAPVRAEPLRARREDWNALYAVAGDEAIYRFGLDLSLDQRIEMEPPPPAP